ncbi:MAG: hypothetical protein ABFS46_13540 [Myxococcota bacterium]
MDALLSRERPEVDDRTHAADCAACGALLARLEALGEALAAPAEQDPPGALAAATLQRAHDELTRPRELARSLPDGYGAECLRLLGGALLPFPLVVAWTLTLLALGENLLAAWLPPALVSALGAAYLVAAAGWWALLYGSLPILAHRRAQRRLAEATP